MIKAIMFDLDDTLLWDERSVKESFQAVCRTAANRYSVDPDAMETSVREEAAALYQSYETFEFTKMIGINPFEALWGHFLAGEQPEFRKLQELAPTYRVEAWTLGLKRLGIEDSALGSELAELFMKERRNRPLVYEETFRVLDRLKSEYKLLLLTNGSPDLQQEKLDMVPELSPYFEHILISGEFGRGKPDPSIFQHALELLAVSAGEAIMIGDKLTTDILGSQKAGIRNVWINRRKLAANPDIEASYEIEDLNQLFELLKQLK